MRGGFAPTARGRGPFRAGSGGGGGGGGTYSGQHIGGNLAWSDSGDSPFVDLVSNSRGFQPAGAFALGNNYEDLGIPRDANGWPTAACELILAVSNNQLSPITGTYAGEYDDSGSSTISLISSAGCSISGTPARVGNHVTFNFVVTGTFTAVFAWTGGISNLKVRAPGYSAGDVLTTPAIDYYKKFACLRAMDFMETNFTTNQVNWSDRVPAGKNHGRKSWECLFDFITAVYNASGSHLKAVWLTPYVSISASYAASLAALAKSRLPAGITVMVETSNELWNFAAFSQCAWLLAWANNASNPDYSRVGGNSGSPSYDAYKAQWGLNFARLAKAFKTEFGADAQPVLSGQLGNIAWLTGSGVGVVDFLSASGQTSEFGAFNTYAKAIAGAPYLQCFTYEDSVGTSALLCEAFKWQIVNVVTSQFNTYKTFANSLGVEVMAYEAGTDMTSDNNIAVKLLAWADGTSSPDNATTNVYDLIHAMWTAGWTTCCFYQVTPNKINSSGTKWFSMWCTNQGFADSTARGAAINTLVSEHP